MKADEIERIVYRQPFKPFRLQLDNGDEVTVARPRKAQVSGEYVTVAGVTRPATGPRRKGLRFLTAEQIVSVEDVPAPAEAGGAIPPPPG